MPFRKKVRKIFSKLNLNQHSKPSTTNNPDLNISAPPPRTQLPTARPPPLISKPSAFPQSVNSGYHPSGVLAEYPGQISTVPNGITPIEEVARLRQNGDGETSTREDGYTLLHPGIETGPQYIRDFDEGTAPDTPATLRPGKGEERKTSQATMDTTASSDYDQHSLTQSLRNTPVPAPGAQLMQDHKSKNTKQSIDDQLQLPLSDLHISEQSRTPTPPFSTASPSPTQHTLDISHTLSPPVIHNKIIPITKEELLHVHTIEHHHHHIQPRIQPVVDTHTLPPKHYLETSPGELREITPEEAREYGNPIWTGETVVAGDGDVGVAGDGVRETERTRLATPVGQKPQKRVAVPILPLSGEEEDERERGGITASAKLLGSEGERGWVVILL
ncbi:hypothetical protein K440DRAFT_193664 [Wilcoxina mikolae CBS 423.85]|nr:hypothetical protein K440DRAFT_193664 [Wilcoxina mikolae CBS 423.85]